MRQGSWHVWLVTLALIWAGCGLTEASNPDEDEKRKPKGLRGDLVLRYPSDLYDRGVTRVRATMRPADGASEPVVQNINLSPFGLDGGAVNFDDLAVGSYELAVELSGSGTEQGKMQIDVEEGTVERAVALKPSFAPGEDSLAIADSLDAGPSAAPITDAEVPTERFLALGYGEKNPYEQLKLRLQEYTVTDVVAGVNPVAMTERVGHVVRLPSGEIYGVSDSDVGTVNAATGAFTKIPIPPPLPQPSWFTGIAFDAKRQRILAATGGFARLIFVYDLQQKTWSTLRHGVQSIGAIAYVPETDALFALGSSQYASQFLVKLAPDGKPERYIRLAKRADGRLVGQGHVQLVPVHGFLAVLSGPSRFGDMAAMASSPEGSAAPEPAHDPNVPETASGGSDPGPVSGGDSGVGEPSAPPGGNIGPVSSGLQLQDAVPRNLQAEVRISIIDPATGRLRITHANGHEAYFDHPASNTTPSLCSQGKPSNYFNRIDGARVLHIVSVLDAPQDVRVVVDDPAKSVVLSLSGAFSRTWRIEVAPGSTLEAVYVHGYPDSVQEVVGLPPGTRLERPVFPPGTLGAMHHWEPVVSSDYGDLNEATGLDRETDVIRFFDAVRAATGLTESSYQGCYEANAINVPLKP